jgi:hypothetical protein
VRPAAPLLPKDRNVGHDPNFASADFGIQANRRPVKVNDAIPRQPTFVPPGYDHSR